MHNCKSRCRVVHAQAGNEPHDLQPALSHDRFGLSPGQKPERLTVKTRSAILYCFSVWKYVAYVSDGSRCLSACLSLFPSKPTPHKTVNLREKFIHNLIDALS